MKIYEFDYINKDKYILLTNFHGSFDLNAAQEISQMKCDYVIITGDLLSGYQWENNIKLQELKDFLSIISLTHPIVISLKNQDLMRLSRNGFDNYRKLGLINNVYPIYNESIILKNQNSYLENDLKSYSETQKIGVSEYSSYTNNILSSRSKKSNQKSISSIINAYDLVESGYINLNSSNNNAYRENKEFQKGIIYIFDDGYYVLLSNNKIYSYDRINDVFALSNKTKLKNKLKENNAPAIVIDGSLENYIKSPILYPYNENIELNNIDEEAKIKRLG